MLDVAKILEELKQEKEQLRAGNNHLGAIGPGPRPTPRTAAGLAVAGRCGSAQTPGPPSGEQEQGNRRDGQPCPQRYRGGVRARRPGAEIKFHILCDDVAQALLPAA